jgi:excisionase family DNA binding protein
MGALSVKAVAHRWDISTATVYNLIRSGELRAFRIGTRGYRVGVEELERWERGDVNSAGTTGTDTPYNGVKASQLPAGARKALARGAA